MPQLSEEELKNMSPEEIAELQKQNCIFCHIISGKVASKKVYEDEKVTAVLDINPANPGHVLLLPRDHYSIMPQIPPDILNHLAMVAKAISHACLRAFKAQGTNIFVANGVIAGQRAQHFMVHIIPRKENDGIAQLTIPHKDMDSEQLYEAEKILKSRLNKMFGIKEDAVIDLDKINTGTKKEKDEEEYDIKAPTPPKKMEIGEERSKDEKKVPETKKDDDEPIDIDKIVD
ncbi:MAG: HIT domain-containing protein, partial [Candidatus Woesearchaeota archaeon]|nr:HIT domain-containing protein [Candidatus Woesearchaeota archaeon]